MNRPAETVDDLKRIYVGYRLSALPGGGAFMSAMYQGEMIDVQDFFDKEFESVLNQARSEGWVQGYRDAQSNEPNHSPSWQFDNPYKERDHE